MASQSEEDIRQLKGQFRTNSSEAIGQLNTEISDQTGIYKVHDKHWDKLTA